LVNGYGQVVGINSVKVEAAEGLGFAIPIDEVKPIVDELIKHGYVTGRPIIGISTRDITPAISKQYDIPEGVYVVQVSPFSGAEKAGIQPSDVIVEANGQKVRTVKELNDIKNQLKAGDTISLTIKRPNQEANRWDTLKINVVLDEDKPAKR
jgi:serine protease Do